MEISWHWHINAVIWREGELEQGKATYISFYPHHSFPITSRVSELKSRRTMFALKFTARLRNSKCHTNNVRQLVNVRKKCSSRIKLRNIVCEHYSPWSGPSFTNACVTNQCRKRYPTCACFHAIPARRGWSPWELEAIFSETLIRAVPW
jgi:hypothetical protein